MLRWALLGTGRAAAACYAPALRAAGHDLAVVASRSLTRAQAFAANHGVRRARGRYEDALEASDVDAVLVALPNALHEQWAGAALEAGKHVLCPAPAAPSGEAVGRMGAVAARTGRLLAEGIAARHHPRFVAVLDLVWAGGIGEVRLISASASRRVRDPQDFRCRLDQGGGALLDVGSHEVAVARWLAGTEPTAVQAVQTRWSTGVDGTTGAVLAFPTGAVAALQASFDARPHGSLEIVGSDGCLTLDDAFFAGPDVEVTLRRDGEVVGAWRADPFERLVSAFATAAGGGAALPDVDDSVATAEVLDRIRAAGA